MGKQVQNTSTLSANAASALGILAAKKKNRQTVLQTIHCMTAMLGGGRVNTEALCVNDEVALMLRVIGQSVSQGDTLNFSYELARPGKSAKWTRDKQLVASLRQFAVATYQSKQLVVEKVSPHSATFMKDELVKRYLRSKKNMTKKAKQMLWKHLKKAITCGDVFSSVVMDYVRFLIAEQRKAYAKYGGKKIFGHAVESADFVNNVLVDYTYQLKTDPDDPLGYITSNPWSSLLAPVFSLCHFGALIKEAKEKGLSAKTAVKGTLGMIKIGHHLTKSVHTIHKIVKPTSKAASSTAKVLSHISPAINIVLGTGNLVFSAIEMGKLINNQKQLAEEIKQLREFDAAGVLGNEWRYVDKLGKKFKKRLLDSAIDMVDAAVATSSGITMLVLVTGGVSLSVVTPVGWALMGLGALTGVGTLIYRGVKFLTKAKSAKEMPRANVTAGDDARMTLATQMIQASLPSRRVMTAKAVCDGVKEAPKLVMREQMTLLLGALLFYRSQGQEQIELHRDVIFRRILQEGIVNIANLLKHPERIEQTSLKAAAKKSKAEAELSPQQVVGMAPAA